MVYDEQLHSTGKRPVVLRPGSQSGQRLFSFFVSNTQGPVVVGILPQKPTLTATYYAETVVTAGEWFKSIRQQRPTVGTSKTILLQDNASAHKAKVTVTFLKEQHIQVLQPLPLRLPPRLPPSPTVPTWLHVTFGCSPSSKKSWLGGHFLPQSGPGESSKFRAPCIIVST